jgi:ethanolamine utilization cobalamin adenosyltransferase
MKALYENNFWDIHPELKIIEEFSKVYTADKSKQKSNSSRTMWAIDFAYNPESRFFNLPDKLDVIAKDFLKDSKFKWEDLDSVIDMYKNIVLSDAERALVSWNEIMTMRDKSLKKLYKEALNVKYIGEVDTKILKEIDTMLANTAKLFDDYKKIKKDYEEDKIKKKGKSIVSLTESGEI